MGPFGLPFETIARITFREQFKDFPKSIIQKPKALQPDLFFLKNPLKTSQPSSVFLSSIIKIFPYHCIIYYQQQTILSQLYNRFKFITKNKQQQMQMNYLYSQYPFLMNLPMIYHDSYVTSANFSQQLFSFPFAEYDREKALGLKVEEKQTVIVQAKTVPKTPLNVVAPKPKTQHLQSKKTQTDSFTEKRNIVPNNINHILAFVQRKSKSESIVKKLIAEYQGLESYTPKRFYCYQGQLKEKLHVHVNRTTLKKLINHLDLHSQIFTVEEQLFYNRICRVLIFYYLRHIAKITILSSGRVKQTSKKDHLHAQRDLLTFMLSRDYSQ